MSGASVGDFNLLGNEHSESQDGKHCVCLDPGMTIWRRGRPEALLHRSDRGSQYVSEQCQRLMAERGIVCSMSRAGNVRDNAAMESFFSPLKTERTSRKSYRTRDEAKADVFDYIERFYNPRRRYSTIGYVSPVEFEKRAMLAYDGVHQTGSSSQPRIRALHSRSVRIVLACFLRCRRP
jgi:hypothetical protein